jgi:hypothetical protein
MESTPEPSFALERADSITALLDSIPDHSSSPNAPTSPIAACFEFEF